MAQLTVSVVVNAQQAINSLRAFRTALIQATLPAGNLARQLRSITSSLQTFARVSAQSRQQALSLGRGFLQFAQAFRGSLSAMQSAVMRAFTGQGALFGLALRLFAPVGGARRGIQDFGLAVRDLLTLFRDGIFQAVPNLFTAMGRALKGAGAILGGVVAQLGLFMGLITRIPFALTSLLVSLGSVVVGALTFFGKIGIGAGIVGGNIVESLTGMISSIGNLLATYREAILTLFGEALRIAGESLGGILNLVGEFLRPIASAFEFLISPITRVFDVIRFAWQNSLIIMGAATVFFVKKGISEFQNFQKIASEAILQLNLTNQQDFRDAFGQIRDAAFKLSDELGISADLIAKQFKRALSVGFTFNPADIRDDVVEIVRGAGLLTIAGGDPERSIIALTQLAISFRDEIEDLTEVSDKLFAAWQVGGGSIEFFARGLGTAAAGAQAFGATLNETLILTGLASRAAQENERIFTGFQRLVERLAVIEGLRGSILQRFETVRRFISEQGEILGEGEIPRLLKEVFTLIQERRFFAQLISSRGIEEITQRVAGAPRGLLQQLVGFLNEQAFRRIQTMSNAIEQFAKRIGELFSPLVIPVANFFIKVFESLSAKIDELRESGSLDAITMAFKNLGAVFGIDFSEDNVQAITNFFERTLLQTLPSLIGLIGSLVDGIKRFAVALLDIAGIDLAQFGSLAEIFQSIDQAIRGISFDIIFINLFVAIQNIQESIVQLINESKNKAVSAIASVARFLTDSIFNAIDSILGAIEFSPKISNLLNFLGLPLEGGPSRGAKKLAEQIAEVAPALKLSDLGEVGALFGAQQALAKVIDEAFSKGNDFRAAAEILNEIEFLQSGFFGETQVQLTKEQRDAIRDLIKQTQESSTLGFRTKTFNVIDQLVGAAKDFTLMPSFLPNQLAVQGALGIATRGLTPNESVDRIQRETGVSFQEFRSTEGIPLGEAAAITSARFLRFAAATTAGDKIRSEQIIQMGIDIERLTREQEKLRNNVPIPAAP